MSFNLLIALFINPVWSGNDTAFKFQCVFHPALRDNAYQVVFQKNDDEEIFEWESPLKRSKVRFEKKNAKEVLVTITTGIPGVSYIAPEQYQFTAPLDTEKFGLKYVFKDPVRLEARSVSLQCVEVD